MPSCSPALVLLVLPHILASSRDFLVRESSGSYLLAQNYISYRNKMSCWVSKYGENEARASSPRSGAGKCTCDEAVSRNVECQMSSEHPTDKASDVRCDH